MNWKKIWSEYSKYKYTLDLDNKEDKKKMQKLIKRYIKGKK